MIPSLQLDMDDQGRLWIVTFLGENCQHIILYETWKSRTAIVRSRIPA